MLAGVEQEAMTAVWIVGIPTDIPEIVLTMMYVLVRMVTVIAWGYSITVSMIAILYYIQRTAVLI